MNLRNNETKHSILLFSYFYCSKLDPVTRMPLKIKSISREIICSHESTFTNQIYCMEKDAISLQKRLELQRLTQSLEEEQKKLLREHQLKVNLLFQTKTPDPMPFLKQTNLRSRSFDEQSGQIEALTNGIPPPPLPDMKRVQLDPIPEAQNEKHFRWWESDRISISSNKPQRCNIQSLGKKKAAYKAVLGTNDKKIPGFRILLDDLLAVWLSFMCGDKIDRDLFQNMKSQEIGILISYLKRKGLKFGDQILEFPALEELQLKEVSKKEIDKQRVVFKFFDAWFYKTQSEPEIRRRFPNTRVTAETNSKIHYEFMFKEHFLQLQETGYTFQNGFMIKQEHKIALNINRVKENKKNMRSYREMFLNREELRKMMITFLAKDGRTSVFLSEVKEDVSKKIKKKISKFREFLQDLHEKHLQRGFLQIQVDNERNHKSKFPWRFFDAQRAAEAVQQLISQRNSRSKLVVRR